MTERLAAVLAKCERIQRGAENLSNVPDHLAERLKVLYSKCERLKHAKPAGSPEQIESDENLEEDEGTSLDGGDPRSKMDDFSQRNEVAMTDPYLICAEPSGSPEQDLEASNPEVDLGEPSPTQASPTPASDVTDAGDEEQLPQKDEPESTRIETFEFGHAWNDLPVGTQFVEEEVPYVVERKVGQSHGSAIYALRGSSGSGFIVKMSAQNQNACARLLPSEGNEMNVKLENVTMDIFEAAAFIQTLTQVISDFASCPVSAPQAEPLRADGPPMVPTMSMPQPEQSFKVMFSESQTKTEMDAAPSNCSAAADVGSAGTGDSCKELPFTIPVEVPQVEVPPVEVPAETLEFPLSSSQQAESATPVELLAPAFPKSLSVPIILASSQSKAKPQEPPQTLSTMLGSYAEEDTVETDMTLQGPETKTDSQAKAVPLPTFQLPKAQTAFGAKIRAAARMAKAAFLPSEAKAPDETPDDAPVSSIDTASVGASQGAVQTWDPATGQFITEEIPEEIAEEFKRKPDLNLEDYQQRVLLAQLHDKKRRLQQQQEERERQRRKLEREEMARQKQDELLQEQRSISAVLESYAQELGEASIQNQSPAGPGPARLAPIQVPQPETPQGLPQEPPMTSELQAAFQAQTQFLMQAQQLAALQTALNASSPGFGPVPGVASVAPVSLSPPALAHLGLASQIYAWMAAQVAGNGLW